MLPRRFASSHDDYQRAAHEELEAPLSPGLVAELRRYFELRKNLHAPADDRAQVTFRAGLERFTAPRYDDLYRGWISLGDEAFRSPSCPAIIEALESGAGRVESFVLPHSYRHLSPLDGRSRAVSEPVEEGVEKRDLRETIAAGVLNPGPQPRGRCASARC